MVDVGEIIDSLWDGPGCPEPGIAGVSFFRGFFKDGYGSGEYGVLAPVEHVACVGADLKETTAEDVIEFDLPHAHTMIQLHLHLFFHFACRVVELHVGYVAAPTQRVVVAANLIDLEPKGLADKIACVVEMKV